MAILMNPATGDNEPWDFDSTDGEPGDWIACPECHVCHPCDDERIYSTCEWAQDQQDMSEETLVYSWADAWDAQADLAEDREEMEP